MSYLETITAGALPWAYATLFLVSLGLNSAIVIIFRCRAQRGRCHDDLSAVQAMHVAPTPRVGGLALVAGALALFPLALFIDVKVSNLISYLVCLIPLVAAGLAEDLGHHVRPRWRLAAAALSGALAVYLFGLVIDRTGISLLDAALAITPVAVAFTIFATAGVVNAFNLIDGLNGLAALTALGVTVSLSLVAQRVGRPELAVTVLLIAPLLIGFLSLNYPHGKIFLGDAGAYLIGFTLAWMAVEIYSADQSVSPFALILIFFWPVADTLLAIWRRARRGTSSARPDRLHFHQLVVRWLQIKTNMTKRIANPVATLVLMPFIIVPQILGVLTWDEFGTSLILLFVYALAFVVAYLTGIKSAQRRKAGEAVPRPHLEAAE